MIQPSYKVKQNLPSSISFLTRKTAYFLRERVRKCGCRSSKIASLSDCEHHFTHVWKEISDHQKPGHKQHNNMHSRLINIVCAQLTCRTRAVTWDPTISKYFPSIFRIASLTSLERCKFCQCLSRNIRYKAFDPNAYLDLSSLLTSWHLIFSHSFVSSCKYLGVNKANENWHWQTVGFAKLQSRFKHRHTLISDTLVGLLSLDSCHAIVKSVQPPYLICK